ncbi:uncharacterized protein LOC117605008 isoform X2 [Osmia lignaria lignaria]|nr:uncharacterized protein LOC117605008 isoform X2 [Osmia lignaria]
MAQRIWITHTPAAQPVCAPADTAYAAAGETRSRARPSVRELRRTTLIINPHHIVPDHRLPTPRAGDQSRHAPLVCIRKEILCTMYEDTEDASDIHEDFFNALALLHSTEDNSTEKLRKMLDVILERKYGFEKTLMARLPKKFLRSTKISGKSENREDVASCRTGSTPQRAIDLSVANNSTDSNWGSIKVFDADFEDYSEKGDIPRISIPDEGSGDGLLCKVCNGAKLGPLILLECQECQEVYHPLCHQPPVVDVDVYDPRIVWRCRKCINTSIFSPGTFDEEKLKRTCPFNDTNKLEEVSVKEDTLEKLNGGHSKNETTVAVQTLMDCNVEDTLNAKPLMTQKMSRNVPSSQLRKRIGSKLSVTRSVIK